MKKRVSLLIIFILIGVCSYSQTYPPPNGYVCPGSLLLNWDDVPQAVSYKVQVFQGVTTIVDVSGLTQSQYLILAGILQSNTQYYWRIGAVGPGGTTVWSSNIIFTTLSIPNAPLLISPPNNSTGIYISPLLDYGIVPGATYYILHLSKSPLFDSLVINDTTPLQQIILQYNTQYYWRMKAGNTCGTGNWSSVWTFTTILAPPAAPVLISPPNGSGACPPVVLDWNDVPTATSYNLQISFTSNFTALALDQNTDSSKYTVLGGILSGNTTYYWRVKASNIGGQSQWSSVWSIVPVSQPVAPLMYPINGGNPAFADSNIVFYWSHVNFANSYKIQVSNGGGNFIINQIVPDTFFIAIPGTFNYNTTYYYRFAALNCSQTQGQWTIMWMFTTAPLVVKNISSEIPTEFKLYSNYPNPFNPTTKIKFSVPQVRHLFGGSSPRGLGGDLVQLKVYDVMGREVQTLVHESLKPGTYETTFDARRGGSASLNSGVYFYKLMANGFTETKKMLLIK